MPRGAMRDPSLVDPVAASNEHNRGTGRGRDTSTATPSGTRAVPRTDVSTRPAPIRNGSRTGSTERAVANGGRSRGDRPAYGVATARQYPPSHGGGGHGGGYYYPWYAPWDPYSFGFFYWDPLWWGASYPAYPGYDYGAYAGGSSSADYGYGSLKLKVKPNDAQVYVDGYFAGVVDDYDGVFQKLNLGVGPHHIEIRADGYEPQEFDVQIQFDETVTYRGELKKP